MFFNVNVAPGILGMNAPPSNLLYLHPLYRDRWWWRELGRVSYLGGREYANPTLLTVAHVYPNFTSPVTDGNGLTTAGQYAGTTSVRRIGSLLHRHDREQDWEYLNRQTRAHYDNIVRTVCNSLVGHATKQSPTRKGDAQLTTFWDGVDIYRRKTMDGFVKNLGVQADVQGIYWACMDVRATDKGGDGLPYIYPVSPLDILDWDVDDNGDIAWLKQIIPASTRRRYDEPVDTKYRFRIWEQRGVTTWETDTNGGHKTQISTAPNPIGVVPFIPFYSVRDESAIFPDGHARLGDFCKAANHVYNLKSLLSEILYKQTFSQLLIPDKSIDKIQMGLTSAIGYDAQRSGGAEPKYLSPDAEQARVILEVIRDTIEQHRQSVGVGRGRQEGSMQKSSEGALELESDDKRSILLDIADECQDFERRVVAMFGRWRSNGADSDKAVKDVTIQYPTDFDTRSLQAEIDEAVSMRKLQLSPEVDLEILKQIVARKFGNMPEDDKRKLIDSLKLKTPEELQQGADIAVGKPIDAPAAVGADGAPVATPPGAAKPGGPPPPAAPPKAA